MMRGMVSDGKITGAMLERGTRDLASRRRVLPLCEVTDPRSTEDAQVVIFASIRVVNGVVDHILILVPHSPVRHKAGSLGIGNMAWINVDQRSFGRRVESSDLVLIEVMVKPRFVLQVAFPSFCNNALHHSQKSLIGAVLNTSARARARFPPAWKDSFLFDQPAR
jgi:hypothetical protein